ncbi:MUSTANG 7 [Hibiscus trionum]|uniref:MUSTANG 7 n=1 Tax=Hibiscus trionum TaxID=183268 RepID=A0A9W7IT59_HIBTR|nr:MUSTANG 7 [Hibiscus trionum]
MAIGKLIVVCQSGGKFITNADGTLSYSGGDAHATSLSVDTKFDDFKSEIADMWKYELDSLTIKYLLPNNKRTLITISTDRDIHRFLEFHEDSASADVYVLTPSPPAPSDATSMPCSRSSHTMPNASVSPVDAPTDFVADEHISPADAPMDWLPDAEDTEKQKAPRISSWKSCITGVDQTFNTRRELHEALDKFSLAHGFQYIIKRSDERRYSARCKAEGCPWFIVAPKLSTTKLYRIKKMNDTHTCGVGSIRASASRILIASIVKEKLRDTPTCKPKEIIDDIRRDFGIELSYAQAWGGIEAALEEVQGSHRKAYNQLPLLCEKILETNPGSAAILNTKEDLSFHRIFVAFHASIYGFEIGCRPLLFLDCTSLKSKYRGELFTATALDGNDGIFLVAFAVVDVLSDDNWHWFLQQLKTVLSTFHEITFVADTKKEMSESLGSVFPNCFHGYCPHQLTESLKMKFKGSLTVEVVRVLISEFLRAAYAPTAVGFKKCIETIKNISPEAYEWVLQTEPEHWANAFFKGTRYNHLKSSVTKSFCDWVSDLPAMPITQVIEAIRRKMMEFICTRKMDSDQWSSKLTPSAEENLQRILVDSRSLEVVLSPGSWFKVRDTLDIMNVVSLENWECSCREWQINGLPCLHAAAAIEHVGKDVYDYCYSYFSTEAFKITYSESINPVPSLDGCTERESSEVLVQPPCITRPVGRPKERKCALKPKQAIKRPVQCSKCKKVGHNKRNCKQSA